MSDTEQPESGMAFTLPFDTWTHVQQKAMECPDGEASIEEYLAEAVAFGIQFALHVRRNRALGVATRLYARPKDDDGYYYEDIEDWLFSSGASTNEPNDGMGLSAHLDISSTGFLKDLAADFETTPHSLLAGMIALYEYTTDLINAGQHVIVNDGPEGGEYIDVFVMESRDE
jgi:hypothetical protein